MSSIYSAPTSSGKSSETGERSYRAMTDGPKSPPDRLTIKVRVSGDDEADARDLSFDGRDSWALIQLIESGEAGCTPIDVPGPRWSHYIWKLRRAGIAVETITEPHGGPFAGHHARYVLRSKLRVLEVYGPQRQGLSVHDGGRS